MFLMEMTDLDQKLQSLPAGVRKKCEVFLEIRSDLVAVMRIKDRERMMGDPPSREDARFVLEVRSQLVDLLMYLSEGNENLRRGIGISELELARLQKLGEVSPAVMKSLVAYMEDYLERKLNK